MPESVVSDLWSWAKMPLAELSRHIASFLQAFSYRQFGVESVESVPVTLTKGTGTANQ